MLFEYHFILFGPRSLSAFQSPESLSAFQPKWLAWFPVKTSAGWARYTSPDKVFNSNVMSSYVFHCSLPTSSKCISWVLLCNREDQGGAIGTSARRLYKSRWLLKPSNRLESSATTFLRVLKRKDSKGEALCQKSSRNRQP